MSREYTVMPGSPGPPPVRGQSAHGSRRGAPRHKAGATTIDAGTYASNTDPGRPTSSSTVVASISISGFSRPSRMS